MKTTKHFTLCILTIVLLLLQLASPVAVRADGETPPPAPTDLATPTPNPVETSPSNPAQQDTPELPVETSTPVPSPTSAPESTIDPAPATMSETTVEEQMTLFEAGQEIADDTNVVVLDENGQPLSLASLEAAQALTNSDPVWCPAGQAPTPGSNGCTISYATLADLVANEGGNISEDGTIWITSGLVPESGQVTINGQTYTTWSDHTLTLQGGWSGSSGDATIGSNSVFFVPIQIVNWNNSIVVNNVNIENVVTFRVDWFKVQTSTGDITIRNSNIRNNTNTSEYTAGIRLFAPDTVTIENSNFDNDVSITDITSLNLTVNDSHFTNIAGYAGLLHLALADCSPDTVSNVFISNSSFTNSSIFGLSAVPLCLKADGPNHLNITIENSNFNNNLIGASFHNGNIVINNSTFNNNSITGAEFVGDTTVNNSIFSGNGAGIIPAADVTLNDVVLANNEVGIESPCTPNINLIFNNVTFLDNGVDIGSKVLKFLDCAGTPFNVIKNDSTMTMSSQTEGEFALDCASVDGYSVNLLNGDRVQIFCPVSGTARISGLDNTTLPAALPAEYAYASAFSLDILQNETPIPVITEGGYLKASFAASSLEAGQAGDTYFILYWDNGTWVPLKEFTLDENGSFQLNPDATEDPREILSGVKLVTNNGVPRVEVSTNFPGVFVLAQH